ncbi:MAG: S-methyl-5-thioribose-1-phosphate isomerase [Candidatus Brocadiia bacterium]
MPQETIRWIGGIDGYVELIDQTLLPVEFKYVKCEHLDQVWEAIKTLRVRGAPAIGVAAAMGLVLGIRDSDAENFEVFIEDLRRAKKYLKGSRPTAVNLFWALDRMEKAALEHETLPLDKLKPRLLAEALSIQEEDKEICRAIGRNGAKLIDDGDKLLTHCNAGGLATADYGTALAVMFAAHESGEEISVFADETRPLLQGARLTTWELKQAGIPVTLICDSMAAQVMKEGRIDAIIVGADRIAANGDTANKIGTYSLSVNAREHGVPFYVAAPISTFDMSLFDGSEIPIEERDAEEITRWGGRQIAPEGIEVYNPAFDVTPAGHIATIITEKGLIKNPTSEKVAKIVE